MGLLRDIFAASGSLFSGGGRPARPRHDVAGQPELNQDNRSTAADFDAHAASRAHQHAAFLCLESGSSTCSSAPFIESPPAIATVDSSATHPFFMPQHRGRTSFAVRLTGPELGPVRTHLVYVSPDVYNTDIAKFDPKLRKHKFAGRMSNDMSMATHPQIEFKSLQKQVHVHLVDTNNGKVFWDGNYSMGMLPFAGGLTLKGTAKPVAKDPGTLPLMRKFFIPKTDPGPHLFDLSINTRNNWYKDQQDTPWFADGAEGFDNLHGHKAHIGIEVYRLPKLVKEKIDGQETGRMIEKGCENGPFAIHRGRNGSDAPCHNDNLERILNKEEDLFADFTGPKPTDGRNFYGWIIDSKARKKDNYDYMFKPNYPPLVQPYSYQRPDGSPPKVSKK